MVIATRNQLIRGYVGIDDDVLWSIVQIDIPAFAGKPAHFENSGAGLMGRAYMWRRKEQKKYGKWEMWY